MRISAFSHLEAKNLFVENFVKALTNLLNQCCGRHQNQPDSGSGGFSIGKGNSQSAVIFGSVPLFRDVLKLVHKFEVNFQMRHLVALEKPNLL